jgi:hypothetical protein
MPMTGQYDQDPGNNNNGGDVAAALNQIRALVKSFPAGARGTC